MLRFFELRCIGYLCSNALPTWLTNFLKNILAHFTFNVYSRNSIKGSNDANYCLVVSS